MQDVKREKSLEKWKMEEKQEKEVENMKKSIKNYPSKKRSHMFGKFLNDNTSYISGYYLYRKAIS